MRYLKIIFYENSFNNIQYFLKCRNTVKIKIDIVLYFNNNIQ